MEPQPVAHAGLGFLGSSDLPTSAGSSWDYRPTASSWDHRHTLPPMLYDFNKVIGALGFKVVIVACIAS